MHHRDIKFTGVRFPDEDSHKPPRFASVVVDVLAIDYFAVCLDPAIDADRPLLEVHLKSGARLYLVDIELEALAKARRFAAASEISMFRFTDN